MHPGEPGDCYIKRLVRHTSEKLILRQYNPDQEITIKMENVRAIYIGRRGRN